MRPGVLLSPAGCTGHGTHCQPSSAQESSDNHRMKRTAFLALGFLASLLAASADSPLLAPGAKVEKLGDGYAFTEGPAVDAKGNVYFTDQPNDRIVRWDATTGAFSDWLKPSGRANGTYFDAQGNLLTCSDELNQLW